MCASTFSCLLVFTLPRASEANMWGFFFFYCNTHLLSEGWNSQELHGGGGEKKQNRFNVEHLWQFIQTVKKLRCDSFPPCSAHTRRHHSPRPPGGGVSSPQTEHTSWPGPAPALPEELCSKPLWGRGGARPTESGPNKRSAHPPLHAD